MDNLVLRDRTKFVLLRMLRRFQLKFRHKVPLYLKLIVGLFIFVYFIEKFVIKNHLFRYRKTIIQNDLLDYNEDGLRPDWPFEITKHYDAYDLRTYASKPKIVARLGLPGERGAEKKLLHPKRNAVTTNSSVFLQFCQ